MGDDVIIPSARFHMLLHGHVIDQLKRLPSESVDSVMTSPPYLLRTSLLQRCGEYLGR